MLKGHGVFSCLKSDKHKAKLRVLYEVAPIGWLVEKAGGRTLAENGGSLMDVINRGYDDRISFAMGS
jgi:sedoheptulose-bisphosphatase